MSMAKSPFYGTENGRTANQLHCGLAILGTIKWYFGHTQYYRAIGVLASLSVIGSTMAFQPFSAQLGKFCEALVIFCTDGEY